MRTIICIENKVQLIVTLWCCLTIFSRLNSEWTSTLNKCIKKCDLRKSDILFRVINTYGVSGFLFFFFFNDCKRKRENLS